MTEARFRNFDVQLNDLQVGHNYKFYITQNNGNKIEFTGDYQGNNNYNYIIIDNTDPPQIGVTHFYIYNITNIEDPSNSPPVLKGGKSRRHKSRRHKRNKNYKRKRTSKRKTKSRRQRRIR